MVINCAIIGCTGYVGEELYRILAAHPQVNVRYAVSKSFAGQQLSDVYKNFFSASDTILCDMEGCDFSGLDLVFTALPHGQSIKIVPELLSKGIKVIDMSGDFRYNDAAVYEQWYKIHHTAPQVLAQAVYGLPEIYSQQISKSKLIANPGCYTTASILALYPLIKCGLIDKTDIVIDAKSGTTGAGRSEKLDYSYCQVDENFKAYGVGTHRHTSEIEQELSLAANEKVALCFTPHLLPIKRGILATSYANITRDVHPEDILDAYALYNDAPFTHIYARGMPEIKHVAGSNNCYIGFYIDKRLNRIITVSCIDNLIKGAAGQAVQNMNLMFGLEETLGLNKIGWYL